MNMQSPVTAEASFRWPIVNSGQSWSCPRVSMPNIFSIQWDMQLDSWFYAGWAEDSAGNNYSINVYFGRGAPTAESPPSENGVTLGVGIGVEATGTYHMAVIPQAFGASSDPSAPSTLTVGPATDFFYEVAYEATASGAIAYSGTAPDSPPVGIKGAAYTLTVGNAEDGSGAPIALDLALTDAMGTVMEGYSGYVGGAVQSDDGLFTYEIAQPQLNITGGTLTVGGQQVTIVGGNLWHDRQTYTYPPGKAPGPGGPLYRGCWMPVRFDNGVSADLVAGWSQQPAGEQWISGRAVGRPPAGGVGNLFFPEGYDRYNGGAVIQTVGEDWDYDINIFDGAEPASSPHWTSPATGCTYCTKWKISFSTRLQQQWNLPAVIYLSAIVQGCEFVAEGQAPFSEGAALMFSDPECTQRIGEGFVEQMGYN